MTSFSKPFDRASRRFGVSASSYRRTGSGGSAPASYLGIVASRTYFPTTATGSNTQVMSSVGFDWTDAATTVQIEIPTVYCLNSAAADTISTPNVTYHCSIEYPLGTFTEVKWAGASTITTVGGTSISTGLSDAVTVNAVKGGRAKFHCYATIPSGGGIVLTQGSSSVRWAAGGDASILGAGGVVDQVMTGGVVDGGTSAFIFPLIVATKTTPTFCLIGDSTTIGSGSTADSFGQTGEVATFFGNSYGLMNFGVGGTTQASFNAGGRYRRFFAQKYATHIFNHYSKNDFRSAGSNFTSARMIQDWKNFPKLFSAKAFFASTVGPVTDAANTITDANNAARNALNTAIVSGLPGYNAPAYDLGGFMESGGLGATGLWKTGYSSDGLHENSTSQAALASAGLITPATLAAVSATPSFTPMSIMSARLPVWVSATEVFASPVSALFNAIGSQAQYTPSNSPTWSATGFSGAPGITLDGTNQLLVGDATFAKPWSAGLQAITLFALFYPTSTPAGDRHIWGCSTNAVNNDRACIYNDAANKIKLKYRRLDADATTTITSTATLTNGTPCLVAAIFDPTNNTVQLFINGVADVTGTFASSGAFQNLASQNMPITGLNSSFSAFTFNTMFATDKAVTTLERQKLEGYFAWQAGVAATVLPAGHPYLSAAPTS